MVINECHVAIEGEGLRPVARGYRPSACRHDSVATRHVSQEEIGKMTCNICTLDKSVNVDSVSVA